MYVTDDPASIGLCQTNTEHGSHHRELMGPGRHSITTGPYG